MAISAKLYRTPIILPMSKKKAEHSFGQSFEELEQIAHWFEQGEPDLEEGLAKFERAMGLAKELKQRLSDAENTIKEVRLTHE